MKHLIGIGALLLLCGADAFAQTPAPPAPPAAPAAPAQTAPRTTPRPASGGGAVLAVQVTDKSGNGIGDVAVSMTGPIDRSGSTGPDGHVTFRSVRAGTHRLRFEREGFVTLEREIVTRGQPSEVAVALNPAPAVKTSAPAPTPEPAPAPTPAEPRRSVEPRTLSIIDFVEKNLIGSEPQKRSLVACTDGGTARILQVRDPLNNQTNPDADQLFYVVAGGGVVRVRDQEHKATPGWSALIPRGVPHSFRRDGRNPLIALTVAMGAACTDTSPLAR